MILIIALRHEHARHAARERGLSPHEWRYVDHREQMMGCRGANVLWYETAGYREDYAELLELARAYEMVDVTDRQRGRKGVAREEGS